MALSSTQSRNSDPAAQGIEARRHQRRALRLPCQFLLQNGKEFTGITCDISPGGLFIESRVQAQIDAPVTIRVDQLGHHEAVVARHAPHGFAVRFIHSRERAAKLADKLTWLINGGDTHGDRRATDRFEQHRPTVLKTAGGQDLPCMVVNISTKGAAVAVDYRPAVGTRVTLGDQPATVVRHHQAGVGLKFD